MLEVLLIVVGVVGWIWLAQRSEREKISTNLQINFEEWKNGRNSEMREIFLNATASKQKKLEVVEEMRDRIFATLNKYDEELQNKLKKLCEKRDLEMP